MKPMKNTFKLMFCLLIISQSALHVAAENKLVKVDVFPSEINLQTKRDFQSIVVQAHYENGVTRDVTQEARLEPVDGKIIRLDKNIVHPVADGKTQVKVSFQGIVHDIPTVIAKAVEERPISFKLDVMPVLMKANCNTGSCHGAARGKDGFMLSLFGYDPDGDHHRITREFSGRRINLAIPEESLMLTKATGQVQHTGGELFKKDSAHYHTMLRWLQAGAPKDSNDVAKPVNVELMPRKAVLEGAGAKQQMVVVATYSDGTVRDVTPLAAFISNNDTSAKIDSDGVVTAGQRGEAFIMARFETFTVGSDFIVIPENLQYDRPQLATNNYIDELVYEKLHKLRITPSGLCTDEAFMRRAYIDITGTLPTENEFQAFAADQSTDKREKLVDELLSRKEFSEIWVMKFAELLQIRSSNQVSYKSAILYYNWLNERFSNNVPMNKIVEELLGATGGTFSNPATNFYEIERDQLKLAENVAQVFMGMRTQCAQCHNHPFDRWTVDDYYSFAAFFSQVGRKNAQDPREKIVFNRGGGEVQHLVTKQNMQPKFLGGAYPDTKGKDRRQVLAEWMASPENPYFSRNLSNIVWAHFFGQGIVEPVDDVRISNPASNPELLDALAKKFIEYNYDFKRLVRDICTSRIYQLDTKPNESNQLDSRNFAKMSIRRLRAEVLLDVVSQVTETPNKFKGLPSGARAVQIADGQVSNYFLTTFGRATRETVCSCEVVMEPNLGQALHLINGDTIHNRVQRGGVISDLLKAEKTPEQIVEILYQRTFTRKPTEKEMNAIREHLKESKDQTKTLEDIFWALLNSKEFIFNH